MSTDNLIMFCLRNTKIKNLIMHPFSKMPVFCYRYVIDKARNCSVMNS